MCSCNSSDFCNFKYWPTQQNDGGNDEDDAENWRQARKDQMVKVVESRKDQKILHDTDRIKVVESNNGQKLFLDTVLAPIIAFSTIILTFYSSDVITLFTYV